MSQLRPANFRDLLAVVPQEPLLVAPAVVRFGLLPKPNVPSLLGDSGDDKPTTPLVIESIRESLPPFPGVRQPGLRDSLKITQPSPRERDWLRTGMRKLYLRVMHGAAVLRDSPICCNPMVLLSLIDRAAAVRRKDDIQAGRSEVCVSLGLDKVIDWNNERLIKVMEGTGQPVTFDGLVQLSGTKLMSAILAGLTLTKEYDTLLRYSADPHTSWYVDHGSELADFAIDYLKADPPQSAAAAADGKTAEDEPS